MVVAVVGLLGAVLIYITAGDDAGSDENFQIVVVGGQTYKIPLESTKMYRRDLQRAGGDIMLLFDDISRWFDGLWRGRSLAITVGSITACVSLALFVLARMGADPDDESPPGTRPGMPPTPEGRL
jgi:hypothetical protein